jgi:hypothetical protein
VTVSFLHRVAQTVGFFEFVFRRQDASGDIHPSDAAAGTLPGPEPLRLLVMGESTAMGLGVATHELGPAAHAARRLAQHTGRGVSWSVLGLPDSRLHTAGAVLGDPEVFAGTDSVVLMAGITDTLCVTPVAEWADQLAATLDDLERLLPSHGHVLVAEIPPMDNAGSISRAARLAAGLHARRINAVTREVVGGRARVATTPFPASLTDDVWLPRSEQAPYREMYAAWGASFAESIASRVRRLSSPES